MITLVLMSISFLFLLPKVNTPQFCRIKQDEWTRYENGVPVCGVGPRGYWTNRSQHGGPSPFRERPDGTWYEPISGKDCVVMNLKEFLEYTESLTTPPGGEGERG